MLLGRIRRGGQVHGCLDFLGSAASPRPAMESCLRRTNCGPTRIHWLDSGDSRAGSSGAPQRTGRQHALGPCPDWCVLSKPWPRMSSALQSVKPWSAGGRRSGGTTSGRSPSRYARGPGGRAAGSGNPAGPGSCSAFSRRCASAAGSRFFARPTACHLRRPMSPCHASLNNPRRNETKRRSRIKNPLHFPAPRCPRAGR